MTDRIELHPLLQRDLHRVYDQLRASGELPAPETLQQYYQTFQARFGPTALLAHDGEALLSLIHETRRDGLIYWLEFKDDDEFPSIFGSIAGGSALKYGFYRRHETGEWMTGSPRLQRALSTAEAVTLAHRDRDQLLAASRLLAQFPTGASTQDYLTLQRELTRVAPDVEDSAWGHKYLSLIHPDKLDDYHSLSHQRFHLAKFLLDPWSHQGRYVNASRFIFLARTLGWPINHLTTVLNRRNARPHRYWRIGTRIAAKSPDHWHRMRRESVVAVGWPKLGDLPPLLEHDRFRDVIESRIATLHPSTPTNVRRAVQQLTSFCKRMVDGDIVLACDGARMLAVGRVNGTYRYSPREELPHERPVKWIDLANWRLPTTEGLRTAVHEYRKHFANWIAIERRVLEPDCPPPSPAPPPSPGRIKHVPWSDGGTVGRIQDLLNRKGQTILYGPPGTGKTYWAQQAVQTSPPSGTTA